MRAVTYIAVFIGGLVSAYLLFAMGVIDKLDGVRGVQEEPSISLPTYLSFISVLLTAVTAGLAALAIGIGIVAAYTFKELKDEARASAKIVATKVSSAVTKQVAAEVLSEVRVKQMVDEIYAKATEERERWPKDPSENEDR